MMNIQTAAEKLRTELNDTTRGAFNVKICRSNGKSFITIFTSGGFSGKVPSIYHGYKVKVEIDLKMPRVKW